MQGKDSEEQENAVESTMIVSNFLCSPDGFHWPRQTEAEQERRGHQRKGELWETHSLGGQLRVCHTYGGLLTRCCTRFDSRCS